MSRAVVFSCLVPAPRDEDERKELMRVLAEAMPFERTLQSRALDQLQARLQEAWPDGPPKVLDCFAGRGIIPLEAMRIGCDVTAVDLNPVAHLIERSILEFPQRWNDSLPDGRHRLIVDFRKWADRMREIAEGELAQHFPMEGRDRPAVYFWARTMPCSEPTCHRVIPLIKSRKLASSAKRTVRLDFDVQPGRIDVSVHEGKPSDGSDWGTGTIRGSAVTCPACGTTQSPTEVRKYAKSVGFGCTLFAVMTTCNGGKVREYRTPSPKEKAAGENIALELDALPDCPDGTTALPDEAINKAQFRILRSLVYGIDTWRGLFTDRQLLVLGTLASAVRQVHQEMTAAGEEPERARALATYLAFIVDKIADRDSSFSSWDNGYEKVRNTFPQQAIRMAWDFTEVNPFSDASGSFDGAVRWIELVLQHLCAISGGIATVIRGNAQALDFPDEHFDAVVTDPPYYDSFQYGDLSDFFYVWLKRSVGHLYPDLFVTPLTPKQAEVVETRADKKSAEYVSHEEFENRLGAAIGELARVVKKDGIVAVVFAHTDVEAWERLLRALKGAGLVVTTSWPMRSEMTNRPTAHISAVLSSSVVLVCRKESSAGVGYYDDVVAELEQRIEERLAVFEDMQLVGADYFVSAIGPAFEVFAKYGKVIRLSGAEVGVDDLMVLARQAVARHAARRLLGGESLSALDDSALLYLTWRWAYDGEAIPADEAYKLGRAFDLDFADLTRPDGIVKKTGDMFHLLGPQDRKNVKIGPGSSLVDVLQVACQLHDAGRRSELVELLGATGAGTEPGFWALGSAIAQALPDGDREKTMLLGLTANQETLTSAAQNSRPMEAPSLFAIETPSLFGDDRPTLFEGSKP